MSKYVLIRSWHVRTNERPTLIITRCGRTTPGLSAVTVDALPLNERSCETCLRLSAHDLEQPVDNDVPAG